MACFEAKKMLINILPNSDTLVPYIITEICRKWRLSTMQAMLFFCDGSFPFLCKSVDMLQNSRVVRPSASIWTSTLFLALSKFCLRTNHCSAWVQSSPWKEHPDFSRRIHPYHKIPGPRWKLIVCGKLRTQ